MSKVELRYSCCDEKFSSSSKIHNHICGIIIAVNRCHISICPESGKEWSVLSRDSYCIGTINIDQPSDTKCCWDFETHWLCYRYPSCTQSAVLLLSPRQGAAAQQTEGQKSWLSSLLPPYSWSLRIAWIPSSQPHFFLDVYSAEWAKICVRQKLIRISAILFLPAKRWQRVAALDESLAKQGKLLFKPPLNCCLKKCSR